VENSLSVTKTKKANFGHPKIVIAKNVGIPLVPVDGIIGTGL
jgi:hypothetical protein